MVMTVRRNPLFMFHRVWRNLKNRKRHPHGQLAPSSTNTILKSPRSVLPMHPNLLLVGTSNLWLLEMFTQRTKTSKWKIRCCTRNQRSWNIRLKHPRGRLNKELQDFQGGSPSTNLQKNHRRNIIRFLNTKTSNMIINRVWNIKMSRLIEGRCLDLQNRQNMKIRVMAKMSTCISPYPSIRGKGRVFPERVFLERVFQERDLPEIVYTVRVRQQIN